MVVLNMAVKAHKSIKPLAPFPKEEYSSANWLTKLEALDANSVPEP